MEINPFNNLLLMVLNFSYNPEFSRASGHMILDTVLSGEIMDSS
jgi:hypothetical protein